MKDIKDIITGVFNTALLINERAKFNFFLYSPDLVASYFCGGSNRGPYCNPAK